MVLANLATLLDKRDLQPAFRKTFETIGMAKVATSCEAARGLERGLAFVEKYGDELAILRTHVMP